jgi:hypothetical protein
MKASDVWDYPITSPTNGKKYKAYEYMVNADIRAGRAIQEANEALKAVNQLRATVTDLAAQITAHPAGSVDAREIITALQSALAAGLAATGSGG